MRGRRRLGGQGGTRSSPRPEGVGIRGQRETRGTRKQVCKESRIYAAKIPLLLAPHSSPLISNKEVFSP
ncbi:MULTISPECIES: hypothetical protein [Chroococcidiopsis]|uniref:hypothetical protein n=1 Tax=Chroococcidiopsis TaxID=54298 RepID=UPI000318DC3D|nr:MULTISPECIES: hypothetical protein [Chroococcidiopsis]URD52483.1 hypothetical protein M5J74_10905 [Chroococcidiopsis sp. CCNUC1]